MRPLTAAMSASLMLLQLRAEEEPPLLSAQSQHSQTAAANAKPLPVPTG